MMLLLFVSLLTFASTNGIKYENATIREECPEGWLDESFFDLGCVWINRSAVEHMSLQNAYEFCYNLDTNARVIEVYREEQMDFLSVIIDQAGFGYYWLGGSDMAHEGEWKWLNSGETVRPFVWPEG